MLIGRITGTVHCTLTSMIPFLICILVSDITMAETKDVINLPKANVSGSLEQALSKRRSVRDFSSKKLSLSKLAQLLWAAQGITHPQGYRTAPSAGALYPLELYIINGTIEDLSAGVYHYEPHKHRLIQIHNGDHRDALAIAALSQTWIAGASAIVLFTAHYSRTMNKYAERGRRYVHIEAGHAAQNLFLQAEALGLSTVIVGAFDDQQVSEVSGIPAKAEPLLLMPVGYKR